MLAKRPRKRHLMRMVILNAHAHAAPLRKLARADVQVFDLDNTLYSHKYNLWSQVGHNIAAYISEFLDLEAAEARKVQKQYFYEYGTTLNGLMLKHDVDAEDYLDKVHRIDLSAIPADPALDQALSTLPGRKLVFTNASKGHADRILAKLGIARHFEAVFDIVSADFVPKPDPAPYDAFIGAYDIDPNCAVYFEDMARNLFPAKDRGMHTVLVQTDHEWAQKGSEDHRIDYITGSLTGFVAAMAGAV